MHTVILKDLKSDCRYEYHVGSSPFWSDKFTFNGRTPEDGNNTSVNLIIFGDWGIGAIGEHTRVALKDELENNEYLALIHLGDFAYDLEDHEGKVGDQFFKNIEPYAASYPYMTATGNHDSFKNFTHYKDKFLMPTNEADKGNGYFYSLNIGPMHLVFINTFAYFKRRFLQESITQTNWLREDLQEANKNRDKTPWIIVMGHHPIYCSPD